MVHHERYLAIRLNQTQKYTAADQPTFLTFRHRFIVRSMSGDEDDYLETIRKNVEEQNAFLANLLSSETYSEILETAKNVAEPPPPPKKRSMKSKAACTGRAPIRKSRRVGAKSTPRNKQTTLESSSDSEDTSTSVLPPKTPLFISNLDEFAQSIQQCRKCEGESVLSFKFNKRRCRVLTKQQEMSLLEGPHRSGVLYWMLRDCRVQDNWALLFAQRLALKNRVPLYVVFVIGTEPHELYPTQRQFRFLLDGLKMVKTELASLNIGFYVMNQEPPTCLVDIIKRNRIGCLVSDFFPLRNVVQFKKLLVENLPQDVPLVEVDAHNIVPVWEASEAQVTQQRILRGKIVPRLGDFLTEYPVVSRHPHTGELLADKDIIIADEEMGALVNEYRPVLPELDWAQAGPVHALEKLRVFLAERLGHYKDLHNDPNRAVLSDLSPWLHFGHISPQRVALEVSKFKSTYPEDCEAFLEQFIVRRELSDNFCFYNEHYDQFKAAEDWARTSLDLHRGDPRKFIYSLEIFEAAATHDDIWNAAQLQIKTTGKMHRYMRMYWAKKILEWTKSPEDAIEVALYLNNFYGLDGTDPNGYVGVMWSICGLFDFGFREREVYGKVRSMVDNCMVKKFDVPKYCAQFGVRFLGVEQGHVKETKGKKSTRKPRK